MIAVCRSLTYGLFVLAFAPQSASASTARVYVTNGAGDSALMSAFDRRR